MAHARLRSEMDDAVELRPGKRRRERCAVTDGEAVDRQPLATDAVQFGEPRLLERHRIIVVETVDPDHGFAARQ